MKLMIPNLLSITLVKPRRHK